MRRFERFVCGLLLACYGLAGASSLCGCENHATYLGYFPRAIRPEPPIPDRFLLKDADRTPSSDGFVLRPGVRVSGETRAGRFIVSADDDQTRTVTAQGWRYRFSVVEEAAWWRPPGPQGIGVKSQKIASLWSSDRRFFINYREQEVVADNERSALALMRMDPGAGRWTRNQDGLAVGFLFEEPRGEDAGVIDIVVYEFVTQDGAALELPASDPEPVIDLYQSD